MLCDGMADMHFNRDRFLVSPDLANYLSTPNNHIVLLFPHGIAAKLAAVTDDCFRVEFRK